MFEGVIDWLRAKRDPLRGEHSAARWAATMSSGDLFDIQKRVVETVGTFPLHRKRVLPEHADALVRVDARVEQTVADLEVHYLAGFSASPDAEARLWRAVFELDRVMLAAYLHAFRFASRSGDRRWSTRLPVIVARAFHYKALDARLRLYRYARWSAAQWREMHQLYDFARSRRWHHRKLAFGERDSARELPSVEDVYLRTLLEQRLDSGSFTPDQVAWVAERLAGWSEGLRLSGRRREGAKFYVDPASTGGLRRLAGPIPLARVLYLDTTALLARIEARLAVPAAEPPGLPAKGAAPPRAAVEPGEMLPAEEKLVLARLANLFAGEERPATPRAERTPLEKPIRVALGMASLAGVLRGAAGGGAASEPPTEWRVADRSRTGYRLIAPDTSSARIGQLVGIEEDGAWRVGVVRRMLRLETDEITYGVEIVGQRSVAVRVRPSGATSEGATAEGRAASAPRAAAGPDAGAQPSSPAWTVYLPAAPENRDPQVKSILLPVAQGRPGDLFDLFHGEDRYLVRLGGAIEGHGGWVLCAIETAQQV
jgi:hypothetical protein